LQKYGEWENVYRQNPPGQLPWELGRPRPVLVRLFERGEVAAKGKALDVCCGLGTNAVFLAKSGFDTTGLDISRTAVAAAKTKARQAGVKIRFLVGNAVELPFADGEFDFVLDMGCFHHIVPEDREKFVKGISRVLKKGGHYFMICFGGKNGRYWNAFSEKDLERIFSPHLDVLRISPYSSAEGDGVRRFFYATLMKK